MKYDDGSKGGVHLDQVPWRHQASQVTEHTRVSRPDGENSTPDADVGAHEKSDDDDTITPVDDSFAVLNS